MAQEYDEAAAFYRRALEERPNAGWIYRNLASSLSGAGRVEEAKQAFAEVMHRYPDLTVSKYKQAMVFSPAVFGPYYDRYYPYADNDYYDDGGCYVVRRRVMTRYGWGVRPVQVCG